MVIFPLIQAIFKQEKCEKAVASLAQMEKRAVMAETMLEATVQYEHGQVKAVSSPRYKEFSDCWHSVSLCFPVCLY